MVEFQSICYAIWILCPIWMVIFLLRVFKLALQRFIPDTSSNVISRVKILVDFQIQARIESVNKYLYVHSAYVLNFVKYTMHMH